MKLNELQKSFDDFEFDPAQYNDEQLMAIDSAFQSGALQNFSGINQYQSVRQSAQKDIAEGIQQEEETVPGVTLPGVGTVMTEKASYETVGDVAGSFIPYIMDRQKLIDAFNPETSRQFGVNYRNGFVNKTADLAAKLNKIPMVKRFGMLGKMFARTVGTLGNAARKTDDFLKYGATQATRTELKSITGGALGAAAGSTAFDTVNNLQNDFAVGVQYDLADVAENEKDKLPPVQRTLANAMEAAKNSLMWAGGMNAFAEMAGITAKAFAKKLTSTGTPESKEIGELAKKYGINLNLGQAAKGGGIFGNFIKTYFETLGIMPGVAVVGKKQRAPQEKKVGEAMFEFAENFAPVTTARILGYEALDVIDNNYIQYMNLIDEGFKQLKNEADAMGNPRMIPTTKLREMAQEYMGDLKDFEIGKLALDEDKRLFKMLAKNDPVNALFLKFADQGIFDDKFFLTPKEYLQLRKDINASVKMSPNNRSILQAATGLRRGLEQDFASVGQKDVQQQILQKSPDFAGKQFSNAAEKNKFMEDSANNLDVFGKELVNKFHMYSAITSPFEGMTAKELKKFGDYLFSAKSELGVMGDMKQVPSKMFDSVITGILRDGSPEALNELRFLVGATDKGFTRTVKETLPDGKVVDKQIKVGENFMNKLTSRFIYDAFFKSFAKQPDETLARNLELFKDLQEKGMARGVFADEVLDAAGAADIAKLKKIQAEKTMANNVERITKEQIEVNLTPEGLGEFQGMDVLRKNLGLTNADGSVNQAGREKLQILFGTGEKGAKQLKDLEDFLDVVERFNSQSIGESSRFLTRRIGLTGLSLTAGTIGAFTGGLGVGFMGLILTPLLLRGVGGLVSNPRFMKSLLDVYTPDERLAKVGKGSFKDAPFIDPLQPLGKYLSPSKRRSLGILLNYFKSSEDEVPIDPDTMTAEQIRDYLSNKVRTMIPNTAMKMSDLPPNQIKKMFPDVHLYQNSSLEDRAKYDEILAGGIKARAFTDAVRDADNESAVRNVSLDAMIRNPQAMQLAQSAPSAPRQEEMTTPQQPAAPGMQRQGLFASLFPNDPTLQMLSEQGQKNART